MVLEEGGHAARTFMEALKGQPLSLALVVMNLALLGYIYYAGTLRHRELELLYENRKQVHELLANCYPAPPEKR